MEKLSWKVLFHELGRFGANFQLLNTNTSSKHYKIIKYKGISQGLKWARKSQVEETMQEPRGGWTRCWPQGQSPSSMPTQGLQNSHKPMNCEQMILTGIPDTGVSSYRMRSGETIEHHCPWLRLLQGSVSLFLDWRHQWKQKLEVHGIGDSEFRVLKGIPNLKQLTSPGRLHQAHAGDQPLEANVNCFSRTIPHFGSYVNRAGKKNYSSISGPVSLLTSKHVHTKASCWWAKSKNKQIT